MVVPRELSVLVETFRPCLVLRRIDRRAAARQLQRREGVVGVVSFSENDFFLDIRRANVGPEFLSFSPFSLSLLLLRNEGFSTVYWWPRMHSSRRRTDTSNFGRNRRFFVSRALRAHDSWVIPMVPGSRTALRGGRRGRKSGGYSCCTTLKSTRMCLSREI